MKEDVQHCLEAGCGAHVAKPIKKAVLLAEIERQITARALPLTDPTSTR
jgi:CheY-like chemotaxis protein